jgi:exodeoxyribonuclease V gamma subunit
VSEHRLHSFSPRYFDGKTRRLFSYSEANAAASRSLRAVSDQAPPGLFGQPLGEPGEEARRVGLKSLIDFFANPAKYFIRSRLRLSLEEDDDALDDSEPFELTALESYLVKQELVAQALDRKKITAHGFAARGMLPLGEMGLAHFDRVLGAAEEFHKKVEPELRSKEPDEPLLVDLRIDPFSLTGQIESMYGGRIVRFRCASLTLKDRLGAWINHLARCAAPLHKARQVWQGSKWNGEGEKKERYFACCFPPDSDPLDAEFETLALEVFEPMLRNIKS